MNRTILTLTNELRCVQFPLYWYNYNTSQYWKNLPKGKLEF